MPRRSPRPYRRRSAHPVAALVLAVVAMGSGFGACQTVRAEVVQVTQNRSWMSEEAMRADFAGQTLDGHYGSGTTWTETYFADGRIDYRESNRTAQGHWHFRGGVVFCTFYDPPYSPAFVGGCWQVIKIGANCFEFYSAGAQLPGRRPDDEGAKDNQDEDGLAPQPLRWNARGWRTSEPSTCPDKPSV